MSAIEIQQPVIEIRCDGQGCTATFQARQAFSRRFELDTRVEAREAGWDVPPPRGKGSRRKTDYCPEHKQEAAGS